MNEPVLPVGPPVSSSGPAEPPARAPLIGRQVTLVPLVAGDAPELFAASHGSDQHLRLWTYMFNGPFASAAAMGEWLGQCEASRDPLFFTVTTTETPARRVGMASFLSIVPAMRRLELGHIWYTPAVQRTAINSEAIYLMLAEAFDRRGYRRVEWKCDALNARSRAAALRLGFRFEGIFRQHMIIRGRNRDTAWFAMLDRDWPAVKANMERWLYQDQTLSLTELNRPLVT
jgi:RimJ/RimL family protein N-acetyltransferase